MKTAARGKKKKWRVSIFWVKERLEVSFEGVQRGFLSDRKGKVIPCRGTENRKGAGTNSGKSDTKNLEAESIRRRAESKGGGVKLMGVGLHDVRPVAMGNHRPRCHRTATDRVM